MRTHAHLFLLIAGLAACTGETGPTSTAPANDTGAKDDAPSIELSLETSRAARTALSGGALTVFDITADAFSQLAPNVTGPRVAQHDEGDEAFEVAFESTPGSANPGLGPVFDNVSCEACHGGDGRGRPPVGAEPFESLLFRASLPGFGPHGGPRPVPGHGLQLQLRGTGILSDANAVVQYVLSNGVFADGRPYQLQVPTYTLTGNRQAIPIGTLISPRVAPVVFGLGLLEAIPESAVLAIAAAQAAGRQVSGRPNYVWDEIKQRPALGRFGWKANTASLVQQTAGAYNGDMGITSALLPAESCEGVDPVCARHAAEVSAETVEDVAFYMQTLGVPARRNIGDPQTERGEVIFHQSGCGSCHVATIRTGVLPGSPEVSNQVIHPYTDLLVHDMGQRLADQRPDFRASGTEWRTPPLWGIGLVETVNGHTNFLHDGRARSLLEAILWHGGEAAPAQARVRNLSLRERTALVAFLKSL